MNTWQDVTDSRSEEVIYTNTTDKDIIINDEHILKGIKRKIYGVNKPLDVDCEFDGEQFIETTKDFANRIYNHQMNNSFKSENFKEVR